jgi:hypothetical protein
MRHQDSFDRRGRDQARDRRLTRREMLALSGMAVSGLLLSSCGGGSLVNAPTGGGSGRGRLSVNPRASTLTSDRGVDTALQGMLEAPDGAQATFWGAQDSEGVPLRITQTLYWNSTPLNGVRTIFDGQGLPVRVEHEENGAFVLLFWEADRVILKFYQPDGTYIGGSVVTGPAPQYSVTQLPDSQIVGFFSGRMSGLTDAIVSFTVGGTVSTAQSRTEKRRRQEAVARASDLTAAEFEQAKRIVQALATRATQTQSGFAGELLKAISDPLLTTGRSELGSRILSTALRGTGVAPVFLQDGLPILRGLAVPALLRGFVERLNQELQSAPAPPPTLGAIYSSPPPIGYRASHTLTSTRPVGDSTNVRGLVASREFNIVTVVGYVDAAGKLYMSGTSAAGDLIELTGTVQGDRVADGQWRVKSGPTPSRDAGGSWDANRQPLGQCQEQQNSGGQGIFTNTYDLGRCGDFTFTYEAFTIPDQFQIFQDDVLIFDTGGKVSGGAAVTVTAVGTTTLIRVVVTADESGTAWRYSVGCPS